MPIRKVEIERFSMASSVGRLDTVEFTKASKEARTFDSVGG